MSRLYTGFLILTAILVLSGCAHRSYHPWLGEDLLINDKRLAGVWQGDLDVNSKEEISPDEAIVVVRPVAEFFGEDNNTGKPEIPVGYYTISIFDSENLEAEATIEHPFLVPDEVIGALYQVDGILIAQFRGNTTENNNLLLAPMHVIYKAEHDADELRLFGLEFEHLDRDDLSALGLILDDNGDGPHTFFSRTDDLTEFIKGHIHESGFFAEDPSMVLKRIRDLSKRSFATPSSDSPVEELVPVPE